MYIKYFFSDQAKDQLQFDLTKKLNLITVFIYTLC